MRKILTAFVLCGCCMYSYAQKFSLKGQVIDSLAGPLPSSTIMILNPKDSSLVNFGVSDAKGFFEVRGISKGTYRLKITFVGYDTYVKDFSTPAAGTEIIFGVIKMRQASKQLDELVIKGEKAPVTVKRDTIEYNASSFKVKANANVEDLLKKMPGMEVENDGTVKAQGEQVQRVMVDGREFFGRDPKLATRNLPADAIDKVQVFDKKSDQAVFTGIDDGQKEKTINLELKEEKRNGAFGTIMAGAGTADRYQGKASINRFGKGQQLSFLGMGNNINEQGFSIDEFMNFTGGSQQMMGAAGGGRLTLQIGGDNSVVPLNMGGRQNGIMTNYAGGLNFNKDLSKKTILTSSYFYNRLDQNVSRSLNRINYLPTGNYNFNQDSRQLSNNDNHRINLSLDHKIDSANSIKFTTNGSYSESEQNTFSKSTTTRADNSLQNDSERSAYNAQTSFTLNNTLLYRHRFAKKGRSFSTNLTFNLGQTDSEGNLQSTNQFYNVVTEKQDIVQTNTQKSTSQSYGASLTYIEPLGGRKYLEGTYSIRSNKNDVDREVYDQNGNNTVFNSQLSNLYTSNYIYNRPGLNLRINRKKYNLSVGASYQQTTLKGNLKLTDVVINRKFENVLPAARFNYDFSTFRHLMFEYETAMQEPTIQQLQPVVNNSDPLNLTVGNPSLKPAYQHRISTNFTAFDPAKSINFFSLINATYTTNAFANSQTVNSNLVRTTQPVNVKDNLSLNANLNFGFPIRKIKSRFNAGPTATYTRSINLLNDEANGTRQQIIGGTARYNFTYKEILTVDLSANLSHQQTKYDFTSTQDQVYFNKTYVAESNLSFLKNYQLNASYTYLMYDSKTTGFKQNIPLLGIYLSRFLLKNNVGELKFGVSNILDKNVSVSQTATANYLQQETTNNLGRYFMVSFTYALNKQLNPMGGGRRTGGMRMIMQQ